MDQAFDSLLPKNRQILEYSVTTSRPDSGRLSKVNDRDRCSGRIIRWPSPTNAAQHVIALPPRYMRDNFVRILRLKFWHIVHLHTRRIMPASFEIT